MSHLRCVCDGVEDEGAVAELHLLLLLLGNQTDDDAEEGNFLARAFCFGSSKKKRSFLPRLGKC